MSSSTLPSCRLYASFESGAARAGRVPFVGAPRAAELPFVTDEAPPEPSGATGRVRSAAAR